MAKCRYCERPAVVELDADGGRQVCGEQVEALVSTSRLDLAVRVGDLEVVVAELREQAGEPNRSGGRA